MIISGLEIWVLLSRDVSIRWELGVTEREALKEVIKHT